MLRVDLVESPSIVVHREIGVRFQSYTNSQQ
jgi:hypothetical protein